MKEKVTEETRPCKHYKPYEEYMPLPFPLIIKGDKMCFGVCRPKGFIAPCACQGDYNDCEHTDRYNLSVVKPTKTEREIQEEILKTLKEIKSDINIYSEDMFVMIRDISDSLLTIRNKR